MGTRCKLCREPIKNWYREAVAKGMCYDCSFWDEKLPWANDPNSVRVGGRHYFIHLDTDGPDYTKGHGGHRYTIKFNDGRIAKTSNLWSQGIIPPHFRDQLPDNAVFV